MGDAVYHVWAVGMSWEVAERLSGPLYVLAANVEDAIATAKRFVDEMGADEQADRVARGKEPIRFDVVELKCQPYNVVIGDELLRAVRNE